MLVAYRKRSESFRVIFRSSVKKSVMLYLCVIGILNLNPWSVMIVDDILKLHESPDMICQMEGLADVVIKRTFEDRGA